MEDLETFYDEYVDKVYKYFYINCFNRSVAEDLTSQTFVSFLAKVKEMKIDDNKKYLYAIMRNIWMDYLRSKYKETIESIESIESIEDFEDHTAQAISGFESKNIKQRAQTYIERLPKKQRQVAHMRLIEEMTLREIAKELGKKVSYVKTTQSRAIKSLKLMLERPNLEGAVS